MKLYHFSDKNNLKAISPNYFGKNCYTQNDKNISNVKRAFFYDKVHAQEHLLNDCKYRYTVEINIKKIYDLSKDIKNLINKYQDIDNLLRALSKKYIGVKYNCGFDCYAIFKTLKTISKKAVSYEYF